MPVTKQKYILNARHQLIDLNKELINFKLEFMVIASDPDRKFDVLVLDQIQLDANLDLKSLEMKQAVGKIGGNIVADKDVYHNYFLVLKSPDEQNVDVEVTIALEEMPSQPPSSPIPSSTLIPGVEKPSEFETAPNPPPPTSTTTAPTTSKRLFYQKSWFFILVIGLIVGAGIYYYLFYLKTNTTTCTPPTPVINPPATTITENPTKTSSVHQKNSGLYEQLVSIS